MSVKLYYFDACGRAEAIRWILSYAGVQFEDIRFPFGQPPTIPPEIKARCRWGQVPLVEIEGENRTQSITQSISIGRYFARKYNLVPSDPYHAAQCDEYIDAMADILGVLKPVIFLPPSDDKNEKVKEAKNTVKARFMDKFDAIIKVNGGKHLVGDKLTWADIHLSQILDQFGMLGINLAEGCENVIKMKESVMSLPKIKAWLEKRPKTPF